MNCKQVRFSRETLLHGVSTYTETIIKATGYNYIRILPGFRSFWNALYRNDCVTLSHSHTLIFALSGIAFPRKYVLV